MRNEHGQYEQPKDITQFAPGWAGGCERCIYGIVWSTDLTNVTELWLERIVQDNAGEIEFCDCKAGARYQVRIKNLKQALIEEARRDPRMQESARRLSHPDIENAQRKVAAARDKSVPSMHYEEVVA